ncbi:unnamed protein product [Adineta ricciae]|nr:unnamed protein product [Adineta ricciae]
MWSTFFFYDNRTSLLYVTIMDRCILQIWPTNKAILYTGLAFRNCPLNKLYRSTGVMVDSQGNIYIAILPCNWITKWTINSSSGVVIVGSLTGSSNSDNKTLFGPYNIALDEANPYLYVTDRYNNRIQRFMLDGSSVAVTVAGVNSAGSAQTQLRQRTDIYLTKSKTKICICNNFNHRIQKWNISETVGTTVTGNPNGTAGSSQFSLNRSYSIVMDV